MEDICFWKCDVLTLQFTHLLWLFVEYGSMTQYWKSRTRTVLCRETFCSCRKPTELCQWSQILSASPTKVARTFRKFGIITLVPTGKNVDATLLILPSEHENQLFLKQISSKTLLEIFQPLKSYLPVQWKCAESFETFAPVLQSTWLKKVYIFPFWWWNSNSPKKKVLEIVRRNLSINSNPLSLFSENVFLSWFSSSKSKIDLFLNSGEYGN